MNNILVLPARAAARAAIEANWEAYHYCLGHSANAELSIGRHLTWMMTSLPDHFMNLVVSNHLPYGRADEMVDEALAHFRSMKIRKLSWLVRSGTQTIELDNALLANGLEFRESFATEMAVDLSLLPETPSTSPGLKIVTVENEYSLRQWIRAASIGFRIEAQYEQVWLDLFAGVICNPQYRTYLALWNGRPVGTSQLFLSGGVAGIYNVTCIPEARGQGIGSAITLAPLLEARELGYQIGILQASQQGFNLYRRLGFEDFGKLSVYCWKNDPGAVRV